MLAAFQLLGTGNQAGNKRHMLGLSRKLNT
jgi:hypothetical protein